MLTRLLIMWRTLSDVFNKTVSPFFTIIGFLLVWGVNSIGIMTDHLFFPQIRDVKITKPIVVVGLVRSGTTFLHRFLIDHELGTGMRLWKMLFPSLTLQFTLKPLLPYLEKISPAKYHKSVVHATSLTSMETDEVALFFRFFDGFFLYGFYLAWAKEDLKKMVDPNENDTAGRDFNFLEKIWSRSVISEGNRQMIPKMFSLSARLPQFFSKFPDAKILYVVRDPLATVPSTMSLLTGVLDQRFGFWSLPKEQRRRYIERIYAGLLDLGLRFQKDYTSGKIPEKSIKIITYDRLTGDFDTLMKEILAFIGEHPSREFSAAIKAASKGQHQYKSDHQYDLAIFGLKEKAIRSDFAPIYETFLNRPY